MFMGQRNQKKMTEPRIYCKTCGEFKRVGYYGGRNKNGWVCKSCHNKEKDKVDERQDRREV